MKKIITTFLTAVVFLTGLFADPEAQQIIVRMEKLMFPNTRTEMTLTFHPASSPEEVYKLLNYAKDNNQKIIVRMQAPARMVGSDLIMLERNVWIYDKSSGREVKIPSSQSFGGTGFSYGDVLRLNYSDNFEPRILAADEKGWTIELTAKEKDAPYYRIVLSITKNYLPVHGTCYARSGDVIKEMEYSSVKNLGSGAKPLTIKVTTPLTPGDWSTLTLDEEILKTYPDHVFNKRNLAARLEEQQ